MPKPRPISEAQRRILETLAVYEPLRTTALCDMVATLRVESSLRGLDRRRLVRLVPLYTQAIGGEFQLFYLGWCITDAGLAALDNEVAS